MDKFVRVRRWMGAGTSVTLMRTFDKDEETGEHTSNIMRGRERIRAGRS